MKTLKLSIFAAIVAVALSGCAGKDGADGAPGAQGPAGNANVSSIVFTVKSTDWATAGASIIASYNVSIIDPNTVNNGAVEAYYFDATTSQWAALPWTYNTVTANVTQTMEYSYWYDNTVPSGVLQLQLSNSDGTIPAAPSNFSIKVVAIPVPVMKAHPNTNWKNYSEVKQVLNLRD
jgi:hypothetical protein